MYKILVLLACLSLYACNNKKDGSYKFSQSNKIENSSKELFEILSSENTGIQFQNKIEETANLSYLNFMHLYMGGGVAIADFNNDGLEDIFFGSNLSSDELYLNKGDMEFENISAKAGISKSPNTFSTGVSVVDINSDGFMDIYLCRSGPYDAGDPLLKNELYVNNGDNTFTEKASEYGIDDKSHSTQALFLDYDRDGDLDLYLVNTPVDFRYIQLVAPIEAVANSAETAKMGASDKLYKNDNGKFNDVSIAAGIYPEIFFGLNAVICDINNDQYPDIYVSNDFVGPDFLYENQKNGTFKNVALEKLKHTSFFSMGSDVSDINNDGNFDMMVLDMSLRDYKESKTSMSMSDRDHFRNMIQSNYNFQYMHNMLHLGDGNGGFSEISQLAGLNKTDWSWSSLFVDFDHDGLKDVYITNGVKRNVQDQDGIKKQAVEIQKVNSAGQQITDETIDYLMDFLPESKKTNYIFKNSNGLEFEMKNEEWLTEKEGITQGASYADLDNDGDLDLVLNNTNEKAQIIKNLASDKQLGNSIIIELKNKQTKNINGIGAQIELEANGVTQKQLISSVRGYFSSSQNMVHFGLGEAQNIDRITIHWPNGRMQTLKDVAVNQKLVIEYLPNNEGKPETVENKYFKNLSNLLSPAFIHQDQFFNDYEKQVLIPHQLSSYGPKLVKGDLDNDGLKDIYITNGYGQEGGVYYQKEQGFQWMILRGNKSLEKEETCGAIADFNNDGYNDIYIGCGSYQFDKTKEVTDYLLFGTANNEFTDASQNIPQINSNTSKVLPFDYDQDGDLDLFIGSRVVSGSYPLSPKNYILENNNGKFSDVTAKVAPELEYFGMISDADFKLENDKIQLAVAGEWTSIGIFNFDGTQFKLQKNNISKKFGWWNSIKYADLDNDGDEDLIAGNLGLNYKFHASEEHPFQLFYGDLDKNGTVEIILAKEVDGTILPIRGKECSTEQLPIVSEKFKSFNEFANQDVFGIYGEEMEGTQKLEANMFETTVFLTDGENFETRILPIEAQFSAVNGIIVIDVNKDGFNDLILAGNMYESEIETTKADAGKGVVLINDGKANFKALQQNKSGFVAEHNVKDIQALAFGKKNLIFVGNNNESIEMFLLK